MLRLSSCSYAILLAAAAAAAFMTSSITSSAALERQTAFLPSWGAPSAAALRPVLPWSRACTRKAQTSSSSSSTTTTSAMDVFFQWFQGDFDNHNQVVEERSRGLDPGPSGGHEHIHCRLEPLQLSATRRFDSCQRILGATYYFDGNPQEVFRCRLYSFHRETELDQGGAMEMRLHRFTPEGEVALKGRGYDLQGWLADSGQDWDQWLDTLEGCEILWSSTRGGDGQGVADFQGIMKYGSCCVGSQRMPGMALNITDNLVLREDCLLVHDRGVDGSGRIIYGNYLDLPYQLERVTDTNGLSWTCDPKRGRRRRA